MAASIVDGVEPGTYIVAISAPGFREKLVENINVSAGREVDLGKIRLALTSCDAPGVFCDSFFTEPQIKEPQTNSTLFQRKIKMLSGCAVNLDKGQVLCTAVLDGPPPASPKSDHTSDLWVNVRPDTSVHLEQRNGARFALPDSAGSDCGAGVFVTRQVRIDGFGPGSDLCIRTRDGRHSHLFFTAEVQPGASQVEIYVVTRK